MLCEEIAFRSTPTNHRQCHRVREVRDKAISEITRFSGVLTKIGSQTSRSRCHSGPDAVMLEPTLSDRPWPKLGRPAMFTAGPLPTPKLPCCLVLRKVKKSHNTKSLAHSARRRGRVAARHGP